MNRDEPNETSRRALGQLLAELQLGESEGGRRVEIVGGDFPSVSPHRLGSVNAAAMAAHAIAVDALWQARGGAAQSIRVDTARAVQALRSYFYTRQNGLPLTVELYNAVTDFHRTGDGRWIYLFGHEHFMAGALRVLGVTADGAAVRAAIARRDSYELEDAMARERVPCCIVRDEGEWLRSPQGTWLAARPAIEIEKIGDSEAQPLEPVGRDEALRPLSGVRVLDLAHVICGPMVGRYLGEHGADVLRVRNARRRDSDAVQFDTAWGKRTAVADLKNREGLAAVRGLLGRADVVVQSFRPGALDRLGLSPAEVAARRPGIVYVSVSCYGSGGPWAERGGYDPLAQTAAGIALAESFEGKPRPVRTITLCDYLTAFMGAAGAVTALRRRAREGGSYHVKVSLTRAAMWMRSFGTVDGAAEHVHLPYADPVPPRLVTQRTPFGMLTALLPGTEYSRTPPYWARPCEPAGASDLTWR